MTTTARGTIRLYYYTAKQWGMKSLWEKRLKIGQYSDLNDPFELMPFDRSNKRSRAFWDADVVSSLARHGVLCFSERWNTTLMWAHYGHKHTGMCLGFDVARDKAEKISYVGSMRKDPIKRGGSLQGITETILQDALRFKHSGWRYEREWRLRAALNEATDGVYYKHFDDDLHLREVILGPKCTLGPADVLAAVSSPPMDVEIFSTRPAYHKFEIRRHEEIDTHSVKGFRAALALAKDVYADEFPD